MKKVVYVVTRQDGYGMDVEHSVLRAFGSRDEARAFCDTFHDPDKHVYAELTEVELVGNPESKDRIFLVSYERQGAHGDRATTTRPYRDYKIFQGTPPSIWEDDFDPDAQDWTLLATIDGYDSFHSHILDVDAIERQARNQAGTLSTVARGLPIVELHMERVVKTAYALRAIS